MDYDDFLEIIKIIAVSIVGYFIIKALLASAGTDVDIQNKCVCDCVDNVIRLGK